MLDNSQCLVETLSQIKLSAPIRQQAEAQLIHQYQVPVKAVISRHCNQPDVADDVFQDTFKTVLEQFRDGKQLKAPDKLRQYLTSTPKHILIAHYRKRQFEALDEQEIQDPLSCPEQCLNAIHLKHLVMKTLSALNQARDREMLYRYFIKEHSKARICQDLDIALNRFDGILFRARSRFIKKWQQLND